MSVACALILGLKFSEGGAEEDICVWRRGCTAGWRNLDGEELRHLYSPNVIMANKPRRMRWARHVARMGAMRNA